MTPPDAGARAPASRRAGTRGTRSDVRVRPPPDAIATVGASSSHCAQDLGHGIHHRLPQRRWGARRSPSSRSISGLVVEQLAEVRPQVGEGDLGDARQRFVGAEREPPHPLLGVVDVVRDLFDRLRGDRGERRVGRVAQAQVERLEVERGEQLAHDRVGEVAVRLLEQPRAAELGLVAPVGQVVFAASGCGAGVVQQRACVPQQVEPDVAERDVFFELGGARDPPAELLRQDQRVVAEPERVLGDVGARDGVRHR